MTRVGQIVGVWGLKGYVKVAPLVNFPSPFESGRRLRLNDDWVTIEDAVWQKDRPYLKLSGVGSPEAARALQWKYLEAQAEDIELAEDEYRTEDLIGLRVETEDDEVLGTVKEVLHLPAHDVLVVGEIMIPAVKAFVLKVDVAGGVIAVRLIEGMRE